MRRESQREFQEQKQAEAEEQMNPKGESRAGDKPEAEVHASRSERRIGNGGKSFKDPRWLTDRIQTAVRKQEQAETAGTRANQTQESIDRNRSGLGDTLQSRRELSHLARLI